MSRARVPECRAPLEMEPLLDRRGFSDNDLLSETYYGTDAESAHSTNRASSPVPRLAMHDPDPANCVTHREADASRVRQIAPSETFEGRMDSSRNASASCTGDGETQLLSLLKAELTTPTSSVLWFALGTRVVTFVFAFFTDVFAGEVFEDDAEDSSFDEAVFGARATFWDVVLLTLLLVGNAFWVVMRTRDTDRGSSRVGGLFFKSKDDNKLDVTKMQSTTVRSRSWQTLLTVSCVCLGFVVFVVLCVSVGDDTGVAGGEGTDDTENARETDLDAVSFFAALSFAAALVAATVPFPQRAVSSLITNETVKTLGDLKTTVFNAKRNNRHWSHLAFVDAVVVDASALMSCSKNQNAKVAEIYVASGHPSVAPRDLLICAALCSRWWDDVSDNADGSNANDVSNPADQAVHAALGGTKALSESYVLVRKSSFGENESESSENAECLLRRLGDDSEFRVRRGDPFSTLRECGIDEETTEELLNASDTCKRAGLYCLVVAAHHGAVDKTETETETERTECDRASVSVASSQTPAAGWTVLGLIAFELGPLRHDTTSVINQLENLGLRFILATESDAAVAAATARRAIFSFRK